MVTPEEVAEEIRTEIKTEINTKKKTSAYDLITEAVLKELPWKSIVKLKHLRSYAKITKCRNKPYKNSKISKTESRCTT